MPKIICKRFCDKAPDGTVTSYRTKYYRYYDGKHASVGSRGDAVKLDPPTAETVVRQLNQIAGEGWQAMDEDAKVERIPLPRKSA
jgi:hypothetical protein